MSKGGMNVLLTAHTLKAMDFAALMEIYIEGNLEKTEEGLTLLQAEQDFYTYLRDVFFRVPGAAYFIWLERGEYVSALRLEPYRDGWLLEALETRPDRRRQGYAEQLLRGVLRLPGYIRIYSHVHKENIPSLAVHARCGFCRISEQAVYIDGSVNSSACTLRAEGGGSDGEKKHEAK